MKTRLTVFFLIGLFASACSLGGTQTRPVPPESPASAQAASSASAQAAAAQSDRHIYVTAKGMPGQCYRKLGPVQIVEPYADSVIDADHAKRNAELRTAAIRKFPGQADAVIDVHSSENDVGTLVSVTGDAVHLTNHETLECAERTAAQVRDTVAPIAAGGMIGTMAGLVAGSALGATALGLMGGAATGLTAAGGYEAYQHIKETRAEEAAIKSKIKQQQTEIIQLREEVARLAGQQCDQQELPAGTCAERQQAIERVSTEAASLSAGTQSSTATEAKATKFQVLNDIQANQEKIKRLQAEVFKLQQSIGQQ